MLSIAPTMPVEDSSRARSSSDSMLVEGRLEVVVHPVGSACYPRVGDCHVGHSIRSSWLCYPLENIISWVRHMDCVNGNYQPLSRILPSHLARARVQTILYFLHGMSMLVTCSIFIPSGTLQWQSFRALVIQPARSSVGPTLTSRNGVYS